MSDRSLGITWREALVWFLLGLAVGGLVLWAQQRTVGGDLAFTLRVGSESGTRSYIEDELGPVPLTEGSGHDGQYYYLVGRDPLARRGLAELTDDGAYRFRRALYGWLAGGFGLAGPTATLIGLSVWSILGLGIASAASADVAARLGSRRWAAVGVLANLGLVLSVQLATADTLALALAMLAVGLALRHRTGWAIVLLAAAALAKDSYVLFAIGLAGWAWTGGERRAALAYLVIPALPLAIWSGWLAWQLGDGLSAKDNLAFPFTGIGGSIQEWEGAGDLIQAVVALLAGAAALVFTFLTRHRLLIWLTLPWVAVALVSSPVVWGDGNNAVRAFAPLWLCAVLGAGIWVGHRPTPVRGF